MNSKILFSYNLKNIALPVVLFLLFLNGCDDGSSDSNSTSDGGVITQVMPARVPENGRLPIAVLDYSNSRIDTRYELAVLGDGIASPSIEMKRGYGSALAGVGASREVDIHLQRSGSDVTGNLHVKIEDISNARVLNGVLLGSNLVWDSTRVIRIPNDVTIPPASTLTIGPGTLIVLGSLSNITVQGGIECNGTLGAPVYFAPENFNFPWGQIDHHPQSSSFYSGAFFCGGGGDASRVFGHSNSEPVVYANGCRVELDYCYFLSNPGKAIGCEEAVLRVDRCLFSRCDTGIEVFHTLTGIFRSGFIDIPDADGIINDDDNDAVYINEASLADTSSIWNCVFVQGEDDAIDQGGANLTITSCVMDGFEHEGVAASNQGDVVVENCLILNCQQGVEAGWGAPQVTVRHSTLVHNEVGFRWGDEYDWEESHGTISVLDCISNGNSYHSIYDFDPQQGEDPEAITVAFSLVNEVGYDSSEGCITGEPSFAPDYLLNVGSAGIGSASDQLDMGLLHSPDFR